LEFLTDLSYNVGLLRKKYTKLYFVILHKYFGGAAVGVHVTSSKHFPSNNYEASTETERWHTNVLKTFLITFEYLQQTLSKTDKKQKPSDRSSNRHQCRFTFRLKQTHTHVLWASKGCETKRQRGAMS